MVTFIRKRYTSLGRYPTRRVKIARYGLQLLRKALFLIAKVTFGGMDRSKYSVILTEASYSPWIADQSFQAAYSQIKGYTLVDHYRLWELWKLIEQVKDLEGDVIEVGVWRGGSGCLIARKCQLEQLPATVYLCDTFQGVIKSSENDLSYQGGEHSDTSEAMVSGLISQMSLDNVKILQGTFPDDTGDGLRNNHFRYCHIDVDVYQSAKDIVEWIWGRMVIGGLIIFDDYGFPRCPGITRLVNERASNTDCLVVYNLNGHAIMAKRA